MNNTETQDLAARIKELGDKSTQILIFLSFALVVVASMGSNPTLGMGQKRTMNLALRWWLWAIWPILLAILPLKEIRENSLPWYKFIRWLKVVHLWVAIALVSLGLREFAHAI